MPLRQPEPLRRLAFGVELDHHRRLAPDHPGVVAGLDDEDARGRELEPAAVRVFALDVPLGQEADVGVLAVLGAAAGVLTWVFRGISEPRDD